VANGQLRVHPELIDLADIASQAIEESRALIEARRLCVRLQVERAVRPLVMGDPPRLFQAITSLLEHAVRSSSEGGEIIVSLGVTAGDVVVRVADTGRGIAPALLPRIFDMCVDDTMASASTLNLGLTLVKRLVEIHDGAVRAWSAGVGQGATFEIRLPLAPQDVELPTLDLYGTQEVELVQAESTLRMTALELSPAPARKPGRDDLA
jgi:signal transduction histidine kinase